MAALRRMRVREGRTAKHGGVTYGAGSVIEASAREAANLPTADWEAVDREPAPKAAPSAAAPARPSPPADKTRPV